MTSAPLLRVATLVLALAAGCVLPVASSGTGPTPASEPASGTPEPSSSFETPVGATPAAAAAPQTASVTIRSACGQTAKVFYGEKPPYSSGTQSSVSSNSVSSKTFRVGDQMWVVDDAGQPLGNVTIGASTREIEIAASCTSLSAR